MSTKSDFAQKLLNDLRVRKERMAATQNSSRQSNQMSRAQHGNSGRLHGGSRQVNALESAGPRTGNTSRRSNGGSIRSTNIKESSNQIVLYEGAQCSTQLRDLSMAIAFAFENRRNPSKTSSNPLVNFFNRFSRRSMGSQGMDMTSFSDQTLSTYQFPAVSHIHVTEISKGVQKLNQILRACSDGVNFDRNLNEIGKELLKGAIHLEESLRMLANMQENGTRQKSRFKLLEEDEDEGDQDNEDKTAAQWQVGRPWFSFDKLSKKSSHTMQGAIRNNAGRLQLALSYLDETSRQPVSNSEVVIHNRSASYAQESSFATPVKQKSNLNSSKSLQEKGRISNVVAKLMGLEELPRKEDTTCMQNDGKGKEVKEKIEGKQDKVPITKTEPEPMKRYGQNGYSESNEYKTTPTSKQRPLKDSKIDLKAEKSRETIDGSSKMENSERNHSKDLKTLAADMDSGAGYKVATTMMNKRQSLAATREQVALQNSRDGEREQIHIMNGNRKTIEAMQIKARRSRTAKDDDLTQNRMEHKVNANYLEKKTADKKLKSNQQNPGGQLALLQEHVLVKTEHSVDKNWVEQKSQRLVKQDLMTKNHEFCEVECTAASKAKKSTVLTSQKKLSPDKFTPSNGGLIIPTEKVPKKDPPSSRHHGNALTINALRMTAANQENSKEEDHSHKSSPREPDPDTQIESRNTAIMQKKTIEVSATRKKAISRNTEKSENPRKIDVLISRRNGTVNHLARAEKQSANMLKELKQQIHKRNHVSKRMERQSNSNVKQGKASKSMHSAQMSIEPPKKTGILNDVKPTTLDIPLEDECQIQKIVKMQAPNDSCDRIVTNAEKVIEDLQTLEQPYNSKDGQEHKRFDGHEQSMKLHNLDYHKYEQHLASWKQEQLTEPEKELKERVIKSQPFLSTAEALFKLNIPVSFLHAGDHDDEAAGERLVVDCAYEVMKRKGQRHEITFHRHTKNNIGCVKVRSLDDLVKQLCKDFEMLKIYGGNGDDERDIADGLHKILNNDIYNKNPDVNSMWDLEWTHMMSFSPEQEGLVRDVEKHMLNGLLDEVTNDLLVITVSV